MKRSFHFLIIIAPFLFTNCESLPPLDNNSVLKVPEMALVDFAHLRNTKRESVKLWDGLVVYADAFDGAVASGNVFVKGLKGNSAERPEFLYGDLLTVNRAAKTAVVAGNPIAEWDSGYILSDAKQGRLVLTGDQFSIKGSRKTVLK